MLITIAIVYGVVTIVHGILAAFAFGANHKEWGPDDEDTRLSAQILLATPVWPLYWGKKLIVLVATAAGITKEKEEA